MLPSLTLSSIAAYVAYADLQGACWKYCCLTDELSAAGLMLNWLAQLPAAFALQVLFPQLLSWAKDEQPQAAGRLLAQILHSFRAKPQACAGMLRILYCCLVILIAAWGYGGISMNNDHALNGADVDWPMHCIWANPQSCRLQAVWIIWSSL